MYLIKQMDNTSEHVDELRIYQMINHNWHFDKRIKVRNCTDLFEQLQTIPFPLDYAIIKLNKLYRNTLYYCFPQIKIIIDKPEVMTCFNRLLHQEKQAYEEVAATIEQGMMEEALKRDIGCFIKGFYARASKAEAIEFYELWQSDMPLNDKKISRLIRTMEFYLDEILNYFDISNREEYFRSQKSCIEK